MWNTGSSDHHFLRQVSPIIMSSLYSGEEVRVGGWISCGSKLERLAKETRITPDRPPDKTIASAQGGGSPPPPPPPEDGGAPNGGNTDTDADVRGEMAADGSCTQLTSFVDQAGLIWGVDKDDAEDKQVRGRIIGPCPFGKPVIYANTPACLKEGISKRIKEKKLPFLATDADKQRIGKLVSAMMFGIKKKGGGSLPVLFSPPRFVFMQIREVERGAFRPFIGRSPC